MPRFTELTEATMTPRQREVAAAIGAGARGGLRGPFPAWLHSPEMAEALQRAGRFLRWETSLPAGGYATPATYEVAGRQYVVIACGGGKMGTKSGDSYVAFALKR